MDQKKIKAAQLLAALKAGKAAVELVKEAYEEQDAIDALRDLFGEQVGDFADEINEYCLGTLARYDTAIPQLQAGLDQFV